MDAYGSSASVVASYYRSTDVRARIAEYCGGRWGDVASFSAPEIAGYGGRQRLAHADGAPVAAPLAELSRLLDEGADICRSLADRDGTLLHLDIDYANPDDPAEVYQDPATVFERLEPVYRTTRAGFLRYGIEPAVVMTGRGYHFMARVRRGTPFHDALLRIGRLTSGLKRRYDACRDIEAAAILGRAHEAAGRLVEHLAHEVIWRLRGRTPVPLSLADVAGAEGGPFVCLDLTAYADPLFERHVRCAFSANQKAWMQDRPARPFVLVLPRRPGSDLQGLLEARRDPALAAELAAEESVAIPDAPGAACAWIRHYSRSRLARHHRDFDEGPRLEREIWPFTYDGLDLSGLPACARRPLEAPNPALLRPVCLRTVALVLWGLGWHPRSVAALVRSRYEKDHDWGDLWQRYDPASRADFYVRLFCGAVVDDLDDGSQFSCESQRRRGACAEPGCGHDLGREFPAKAACRVS